MRIDPDVVVLPVDAEASQQPGELDARLERIRALIDRGEYPIDLSTLASRILEDGILSVTRS